MLGLVTGVEPAVGFPDGLQIRCNSHYATPAQGVLLNSNRFYFTAQDAVVTVFDDDLFVEAHLLWTVVKPVTEYVYHLDDASPCVPASYVLRRHEAWECRPHHHRCGKLGIDSPDVPLMG